MAIGAGLLPARRLVPFTNTSFLRQRLSAPRSTRFPYTTPFRSGARAARRGVGREHLRVEAAGDAPAARRSEEHTSELLSQFHLVCRLLLEKKKKARLFCGGPCQR